MSMSAQLNLLSLNITKVDFAVITDVNVVVDGVAVVAVDVVVVAAVVVVEEAERIIGGSLHTERVKL